MLPFSLTFRRWALVCLSAGTLFLSLGCRRASPVDEAAAANRLLVGNGLEPSSLDPHTNTGSNESLIINALFEPLVEWNDDASDVMPAAAASWEVSDDGTTYTFHLRPEAKWSNGDPVTAHDWARSLQRWVTPSLAAQLANKAYDVVGAEDFNQGRLTDPSQLGFRALDDHTLVIQLRAPTAGFLGTITAYPWLPVHLPSVEAAGGIDQPGTDFTKPGKLISNGAFMLTVWRPNQYIQVERNPHYHGTARLDQIRFFATDNLETEERMFRNGQLHITSGVPAFKITAYEDAGDPALHTIRRAGTRFMVFNVERPPFDDVRVRRAFALAINRQQLIDAVLRGGAPVATTLAGPVPGGYTPRFGLQESAEEARRLLAAAGYPDGTGLPPVEYLYNTLDRNRDVAEVLQQMWRDTLGVDVILRNEEWKVFLDTRTQGNFQLARAGWLPWTPEPIEMFELKLSTIGVNDSNWASARYDELYYEARRTLDDQARYALYDELDKILTAEMPVVPTAHYTISRLLHPAVTGWPDNILETFAWRNVGLVDAP